MNLCKIFSLIFNELYLHIHLMTVNRVKLWRAVTFMKYLASVVSLIFLALIWNKITLPASNSPNLTELVVNEPTKSISKKSCQYLFFC